ncbi:MAG: hypothetical protein HN742_17535 [Lentisphaerae bacterium]|jgi:hypothetical protein|nr:hypothetical protein [Lentisphaerota bacterium]MBT5611917.1 hypothetical protein [Lentisphaerota bacterium]MBT7057929.1 hypothetical protein [Lentisphaerota bacterium]MBT7843684.1 hypothetical protein [Lentisphaerota bacterium]
MSAKVPDFPHIPDEYLREEASIPEFWLTDLSDIRTFLAEAVSRGTVASIGDSAGGRPIQAVFYGESRGEGGTTNFSGALGFRDVRAYFGPGSEKRVYMAMGAVHASEYEGVAGLMNLVSVLETGRDLRGKEWPEISDLAEQLDRLILIPVTNVDGRARIPQRMFPYRGTDNTIYQYFGTGGWADGTNIGWPTCKEFIPLEFSNVQFPGGYPNDAGVNIQHDDFFSSDRQPETEALLRLTADERPDLIVNMHTGAPPRNYFTRMHRPYAEPALMPSFEELYRRVHTRLAVDGLQSTRDPAIEADPSRVPQGVYNLDTALNLHCGALSVLIEAPCHAFSGLDRDGNVVARDPEALVDAQLTCHQEAMRFLAETGGRCAWTPGR